MHVVAKIGSYPNKRCRRLWKTMVDEIVAGWHVGKINPRTVLARVLLRFAAGKAVIRHRLRITGKSKAGGHEVRCYIRAVVRFGARVAVDAVRRSGKKS